MNSWKSTELSAWAPPLRTFIIGTGRMRRLAAAVELGQVAVERLLGVGRGGLGGRQGDAEQRVGAEPALVRGAVELDHRPVERALLGGAGAGQRRGDLAVDVGDRAGDALAGPALAAVAQLDRLELAGRGARGDRGEAAGAGLQRDLDLDGRVAARVEDLARVDGGDGAHGGASLFRRRTAALTPDLPSRYSPALAALRSRFRQRFFGAGVSAAAPAALSLAASGRGRWTSRSPCGLSTRDGAGQRRLGLFDRGRAFGRPAFSGSLRSRRPARVGGVAGALEVGAAVRSRSRRRRWSATVHLALVSR